MAVVKVRCQSIDLDVKITLEVFAVDTDQVPTLLAIILVGAVNNDLTLLPDACGLQIGLAIEGFPN